MISCNESTPFNPHEWELIEGRDEKRDDEGRVVRSAIYRAKIPSTWKREHSIPEQSNADTKSPIAIFFIQEDELRVTIHNFPSETLDERIPPSAQVARWQSQFKEIDSTSIVVIPQAYGGFAGLFFEAQGHLNSPFQKEGMLAWSMQLDPTHYQTLKNVEEQSPNPLYYKQLASDYTIKVVGPSQMIEKHREEILQFAKSFELIDPIPEK